MNLLFFTVVAIAADGEPRPSTNGTIVLDGTAVAVSWDDGDTFYVPSTKMKARLDGFNTLEGYGPVHRFGPGEESLYAVAKAATVLARSENWECETQAGGGGYGRKRVNCPSLRRSMLEQGLAHAFSISGGASEADLAAQQAGIDNKRGMWSSGAPAGIVTSVHSVDEKDGQKETYNRVYNPVTGEASKWTHAATYAPCTWVCPEANGKSAGSCMLYVPYKQRYGESKAACLSGKK
jgi:endonuclease YncB( thermonuclease family)